LKSGLHRRRPGRVITGVTFEQFAATRLPSLLRSAVLLTGDRDLAQDVVQEVMARAQVKWKKIGRSQSPEADVRRMILKEYLSWRRSWAARNIRAVGERLVGLDDAQKHGRGPVSDAVEADDLWNRLATLGRRERAVIVLRCYEQYDDDGIAYQLGCSTATVRGLAAKALKTLRLASEQNPIPVRETR
jgi:RNA polymerase sigma factor (sigma-70 family)